MGHFHSTFYSFGGKSKLSANAFQKYFLDYDSNQWVEEGGGSIQFFQDSGWILSLTIIQSPLYGISLFYDCYDPVNRNTIYDFCSVGDEEKLVLIEDIGDEEFYPVGAFMAPEDAWLAVEDFFKKPTEKSERIEWISSELIEW